MNNHEIICPSGMKVTKEDCEYCGQCRDMKPVPYIKKKKSSTSKSKEKSNHKHQYEECLLVHKRTPHWATVCKICGKINNLHFFETEKMEDGIIRQLDYDEVFEKFVNLKHIEIDDIWQKYVPIEREE